MKILTDAFINSLTTDLFCPKCGSKNIKIVRGRPLACIDCKWVYIAPFISSKRTGRNEPCLCGSGKKFKKCCINKVV